MFKKAGLPATVSSHSGRRGFATKLITNGIDIKSVSVLMGHSNISQTAQYVETNPDLLKKVVAGAF
jgi:integrase/recombinase XerD